MKTEAPFEMPWSRLIRGIISLVIGLAVGFIRSRSGRAALMAPLGLFCGWIIKANIAFGKVGKPVDPAISYGQTVAWRGNFFLAVGCCFDTLWTSC